MRKSASLRAVNCYMFTGLNWPKLRCACGHVDVGMCPHQVLAATLTLFQPGEADYAHHILMSPVLKATGAPETDLNCDVIDYVAT